MKAFPHLVEMHKKYADKGLVVICVSVDEVDKQDHLDAANAFLKKQNPPFIKLLLNAPHALWSKKLDYTIPPFYYVFDREGRWVRFPSDDDGDDYYSRMDRLIIRLLDQK